MEPKKLAPEQINEGYAKPIATLVAFGLAQVKNEEAKEVIAQVKESVNIAIDAIDLTNPPSLDDAIDAILKVADTSAELTKTEVDDAVVDVVELVNDIRKGDVKAVPGFFKLLGEIKNIKKTTKAEASDK